MKAVEWLDKAKEQCGWESDYRAAKELCITRSTVSGYRTGTRLTLDEDVCIKLAEAMGIKPGVVLFDQMRERAKNPKVQAAFDDALKRIGKAAACILLGCLLAVTTVKISAPAYAGALTALNSGNQSFIHRIN